MAKFDGQHIIVTGGTGALGTAVVELLSGGGAMCHVPALTERDAAKLAGRERTRCTPGVDLTDDAAVVRYYESVGEAAGGAGLWASIHIAGGFDMGPIEGSTADDWRKMMELNATTCFLCCREAVRVMRAGGVGGRIVNVGARPALRPEQGAKMVAYTASKAAVAAMTGALGAEVAGDGILVNAVAPSIMDTPANRGAMPGADHSAWPKVGEVAAAIAFLASRDNALTSGAVVPVYGRA